MIEEELDEALSRQASKERASKAALIRRYVREKLKPAPVLERDPLWDMVGADPHGEPGDVDTVVYR